MAEASERMKLDEYMLAKGMTKEQVFQAISRKEISGSFVAGEWMILDDNLIVEAAAVLSEENQKLDARLARERDEAIAKIAMAQTLAKTAQKEARKSTEPKINKPAVSPPSPPREGPKSEVLKAPIPETPPPSTENGLGGGKLDLRKSGMAESILAEARELALGARPAESQAPTKPPQQQLGSLAAGILAEARDLAKLHDDMAVTAGLSTGSAPDMPGRDKPKIPKFIARQFDDEARQEDEEETEERWKTKLDDYVVNKGISMEEAFKMITRKQVNGQFVGGAWYIVDNDQEHAERKRNAAASAAVAEQQLRAEQARQEQLRRKSARRKIKMGEYMMEKGLQKEQVFKQIQTKTIEGHFESGEWLILESEEDFIERERLAEIEQQALNELEKAKEEAYKERRHEAALQDGLNEEERARALNMPFITDAKFADRAVVRTIGVVQGSTVRAKGLPSELSNDVAAMPGAELVSFTADLTDARAQAIDRMKIQAFVQGANAVISTNFSTSMIDLGAIEILVYGTAVVVASPPNV